MPESPTPVPAPVFFSGFITTVGKIRPVPIKGKRTLTEIKILAFSGLRTVPHNKNTVSRLEVLSFYLLGRAYCNKPGEKNNFLIKIYLVF